VQTFCGLWTGLFFAAGSTGKGDCRVGGGLRLLMLLLVVVLMLMKMISISPIL
jgi:hypothetical protein